LFGLAAPRLLLKNLKKKLAKKPRTFSLTLTAPQRDTLAIEKHMRGTLRERHAVAAITAKPFAGNDFCRVVRQRAEACEKPRRMGWDSEIRKNPRQNSSFRKPQRRIPRTRRRKRPMRPECCCSRPAGLKPRR